MSTKQQKQFEIQQAMKKDQKKSDKWIKECGLNPKSFDTVDFLYALAVTKATDLHSRFRYLLEMDQLELVEKFLQKNNTKKSRGKIYKILKLHNKIKNKAKKL